MYIVQDAGNIMLIVAVNRHDDLSSNPGRGCYYFTLVWFLCLMAYQLFIGYLMPKPFS